MKFSENVVNAHYHCSTATGLPVVLYRFEIGSPAVRVEHRYGWTVKQKRFLRGIFRSKRDEAHRRSEKIS
jgi:hypothetical protein